MPYFETFSLRALTSWRPEAVGSTEAGREASGFKPRQLVTQQMSCSIKSRTEVRGFRPKGFAKIGKVVGAGGTLEYLALVLMLG